MSESADVREMFFGLEEYFNFLGNSEDFLITRELGKVFVAEDFKSALLAAYVKILYMRERGTDSIIRAVNDYLKKEYDHAVIHDAMSRSQLRSKIWLIEELSKIQDKFDNVVILAGWFGQLKFIYDQKLKFDKMRIVELDKSACEVSDYIFNISSLAGYRVKSVLADINSLELHRNGYKWDIENFKDGIAHTEKFLPNLIINTSAEHMSDNWYQQIRFKNIENNPIIAIQSNNLFDIEEHVNCVHSIEHMKKKYPMSEILYEGELQLKGYKRVMLIGRP